MICLYSVNLRCLFISLVTVEIVYIPMSTVCILPLLFIFRKVLKLKPLKCTTFFSSADSITGSISIQQSNPFSHCCCMHFATLYSKRRVDPSPHRESNWRRNMFGLLRASVRAFFSFSFNNFFNSVNNVFFVFKHSTRNISVGESLGPAQTLFFSEDTPDS